MTADTEPADGIREPPEDHDAESVWLRLPPRRRGGVPGPGRPSDLAFRLVAGFPELILCVTLAVAMVTEVGLVLRHFYAVPTVVLGVLIGAPVGLLVVLKSRYSRDDRIGSVGMVLLTIPLTIPNYALASQWLSVERDPGFYTVTAKWFTRHSSPLIDGAAAAFGQLATQPGAAGFSPKDGGWQPQSSHLVPALVSILGRGGDQRLLGAGALIGAVALLALYLAARELVGPFWAWVPPLALAVSMPFVVFTRGIYTEPLTLVFAFSALALAIRAMRVGVGLLFVVAGTAAGAASMTRIDGLIVTAPLIGGLALLTALRGRADYRRSWSRLLAFAAPALVGAGLGTAELAFNSAQYFSDLGPEFRPLLLMAVAIVGGSAVLAMAARSRWWASLVTRPPGRLPAVGATFVVLASIGLALRPRFWVGQYIDSASYFGAVIRALQIQSGLPQDGSRSYDEQSMQWMSWYIGLPAMALAIVGFTYLVARAMSKRSVSAVLICVLVGCSSALYLNRVFITPDQIWAARRFVPVIIPGFLVAATVAMQRLSRYGGLRSLLACLLTVVAVLAPLGATLTLYTFPETSGWLATVRTVCASVDNGRVLVGGAQLYSNLAITVRAWCDVPVAAQLPSTDLAGVAKVNPRPLYVLTSTPQQLSDGTASPAFTTFTVATYEQSLIRLPQKVISTPMTLFLTTVDGSGRITTVTPTP